MSLLSTYWNCNQNRQWLTSNKSDRFKPIWLNQNELKLNTIPWHLNDSTYGVGVILKFNLDLIQLQSVVAMEIVHIWQYWTFYHFSFYNLTINRWFLFVNMSDVMNHNDYPELWKFNLNLIQLQSGNCIHILQYWTFYHFFKQFNNHSKVISFCQYVRRNES